MVDAECGYKTDVRRPTDTTNYWEVRWPDAPPEASVPDTRPDTGGVWEPCCQDGQLTTCHCPPGAACNYGRGLVRCPGNGCYYDQGWQRDAGDFCPQTDAAPSHDTLENLDLDDVDLGIVYPDGGFYPHPWPDAN